MASFGIGASGIAKWEDIKDYDGPYAEPSGEAAKSSVGRWFNYFWREALRTPENRNEGSPNRNELLRIFNQVFDFDRKNKKAVVKTAFDLLISNQPTRVRTEIFMKLIDIGFKGYNVASLQDMSSTFAEMIRVNNDTIRLGFRCDSRPWVDVESTAGAKRKTEVDNIRRDWGFDKLWHPFSDDDVRNKLWFRKGVNDNCLHATLSVGAGLIPVTRFPRIDEVDVFGRLPNKALKFWTPTERESLFAKGKIKFVNVDLGHGVETMFWTKTNIYVFKASGLPGINTETIQGLGDQFPERGLTELSADKHLAMCEVRRIHFGYPQVDELVAYKTSDWEFTPNEPAVKLKLGDSDPLLNAFKQKLNILKNKLPSTPEGYQAVGFPRDYAVLSWNIRPQDCVFPASAPKPTVQPPSNVVLTQAGATKKVV